MRDFMEAVSVTLMVLGSLALAAVMLLFFAALAFPFVVVGAVALVCLAVLALIAHCCGVKFRVFTDTKPPTA